MKKFLIKKWLKKAIVLGGLACFTLLLINYLNIDGNVALATADEADDAASTLNTIRQVLGRLLWPILYMIGGLLDNSILYSDGMEYTMRQIWVAIRNVVNIFFVVILVGVALYNIVGLGGDDGNYSVKSLLPKIIVGIIAINFSFLGIKVFLDMINVLTVSVFALPANISEEYTTFLNPESDADKKKVEKFCLLISGYSKNEVEKLGGIDALKTELEKQHQLLLGSKYVSTIGINITETGVDVKGEINTRIQASYPETYTQVQAEYAEDVKNWEANYPCTGLSLNTKSTEQMKRFNSKNAALAMAINMGHILYFDEIEVQSSKDLSKLGINVIFSIIMFVVYCASFLALLTVLLARLVVMWISIVLSPILILVMFVPAIKENMEGFGDLSQKFVKNAIAPLTIAVALSVGWIMLGALGHAESTTSNLQMNGFPVAGINTLQQLIQSIGVIAVVWIGVFSAASGTVAESFTNSIKDMTQRAGKWIGSIPIKHMPLVPIKKADQPGKTVPLGDFLDSVKYRINQADQPSYKTADYFGWRKDGDKSTMNDLKDSSNKESLAKHLANVRTEEYKKVHETLTKDQKENYEKLLSSGGLSTTTQRQLRDFMNSPTEDGLRDLQASLKEEAIVKNQKAAEKKKPEDKKQPPKPKSEEEIKTEIKNKTSVVSTIAQGDPKKTKMATKKSEMQMQFQEMKKAKPTLTFDEFKNQYAKGGALGDDAHEKAEDNPNYKNFVMQLGEESIKEKDASANPDEAAKFTEGEEVLKDVFDKAPKPTT